MIPRIRRFGYFKTFFLAFTTILIPLFSLAIVANLVGHRQIFNQRAAEYIPIISSNEEYPLNIPKQIYNFSIDADITLDNIAGFLRVILIDSSNAEHLVYETNSLLSNSKNYSVSNACDETCLMEPVTPVKLKIEKEGASLVLKKTYYSDTPKTASGQTVAMSQIQTSVEQLRLQKESEKIMQINNQIKAKGLRWTAGETSVSKMTYAQKKKLFSNPDGSLVTQLPNLQGFEYYKGGIFEIMPVITPTPTSRPPFPTSLPPTKTPVPTFIPTSTPVIPTPTVYISVVPTIGITSTPTLTLTPTPFPVSLLPGSWDWRNVHGENWITTIKDQGGCGSCWAFAVGGALEADINLYYNQHLNFNLSEQDLVSCSGAGSCNGGWPHLSFDYIKTTGIVDENCFPYQGTDLSCNECNNNVNRRILIEKNTNIWTAASEDILKRLLIEKGVLSGGIYSWRHAMALVGYGVENWRLTDRCDSSRLCDQTLGCIAKGCTKEGEEKILCGNSIWDDNLIFNGRRNHYFCNMVNGRLQWVYSNQYGDYCKDGEVCFNGQCQPGSNYPVQGTGVCVFDYHYIDPIADYRQFLKGRGDTVWLFKNSWGEGFGETGYVRIKLPITDVGYINSPGGPFTLPTDHSLWPSGFDGQIKCVDKDSDSYCNWGISETKPSICPAFCKPQKDCDDSNPNSGTFNDNYNCVEINVPTLTPRPTATITTRPTSTPTTRPTNTPSPRPTATKTPTPRPTSTPTPRPARIQGRIYYDKSTATIRASSTENFGPVLFRMDFFNPYTQSFVIGGGGNSCTDSCTTSCTSSIGNGGYSTANIKAGNGYQLRLMLSDSNWIVSEAYLATSNTCLSNRIGGVSFGGANTNIGYVYNINLVPGDIQNIWFGVKPK